MFAQSRSISSGSSSRTRIAARQAAATAGGCEVEKRNGRARWMSISRRVVRPGHVPAEDAHRLAQGADLDGDAAVEVEVVDAAAAVPAEHARGVGVVHEDGRAVLLGRVHDPGQRRDVAVHAEDAVRDDEDRRGTAARPARPVAAGRRQQLAQVRHVLVPVDDARRLGRGASRR